MSELWVKSNVEAQTALSGGLSSEANRVYLRRVSKILQLCSKGKSVAFESLRVRCKFPSSLMRWFLAELIEAGFITQTPSHRFKITLKGLKQQTNIEHVLLLNNLSKQPTPVCKVKRSQRSYSHDYP